LAARRLSSSAILSRYRRLEDRAIEALYRLKESGVTHSSRPFC
jgi:hypothetical protein